MYINNIGNIGIRDSPRGVFRPSDFLCRASTSKYRLAYSLVCILVTVPGFLHFPISAPRQTQSPSKLRGVKGEGGKGGKGERGDGGDGGKGRRGKNPIIRRH